MMAYAAKDGKFGFQVFKSGEQKDVTIVLDHEAGASDSFEFDMVPPAPSANIPEVTPEMRAENDRRVRYEDSLRNAYIADCKKAQQELISNTGNKTLCSIYEKTWGNYQTIADFVKYASEKGKEVKAIQLLENISDKDLRDISFEVLKDHFDNTPDLTSSIVPMPPDLYAQYILNPRISNEMIVPWRKTLAEWFPEEERQARRKDPMTIINYISLNFIINDDINPQRIPISPLGVLKEWKADQHSRDIFFVAMARSLGIAARINPINGNVEYYNSDKWNKVYFETIEPKPQAVGYLDLRYQPNGSTADPKYYTHFSIKKFDGQSFQLLAYDAQDPGIDDGMTLSSFEHPTPLEPGYYILTGGTRLPDGIALTHSQFFTINEGKTTQVELVLRQLDDDLKVLGRMDVELSYLIPETNTQQTYHMGDQKPLILAFLDHGSEPTIHAMQDISTFAAEFEKSNVDLLFLFNNEEAYQQFMLKKFNDLPSGVIFGMAGDDVYKKVINNLGLEDPLFPVFILAKPNQEVVFEQTGYTIGLGEQLLKTLDKIR